MKALIDYLDEVVNEKAKDFPHLPEKLAREKAKNFVLQGAIGGGTFEYCVNLQMRGIGKFHGVGQKDLIFSVDGVHKNRIEIKSGESWLADTKGNGFVLYCPIVKTDRPLKEQNAFLIEKNLFLSILAEVDLLQIKNDELKIKQFYTEKRGLVSKKKYLNLLELLEKNQVMSFQEFLNKGVNENV